MNISAIILSSILPGLSRRISGLNLAYLKILPVLMGQEKEKAKECSVKKNMSTSIANYWENI